MTDKPRILVVDDEVPIQEFLKTRLKKLYDISCATYQDEAFAALEKSSFDLVLLDLKLPRNRSDMNPSPDVGVDILRQIRERKICRRGTASPLPVVVMTAFGKDKLLSADFLQHRGRVRLRSEAIWRRQSAQEEDRGRSLRRGQLQCSVSDHRQGRAAHDLTRRKSSYSLRAFKYTGATYKLLRRPPRRLSSRLPSTQAARLASGSCARRTRGRSCRSKRKRFGAG